MNECCRLCGELFSSDELNQYDECDDCGGWRYKDKEEE